MASIYNLTPATIRAWAILSHRSPNLVTHNEIEKFCKIRKYPNPNKSNKYHKYLHSSYSLAMITKLRKVIGFDKITSVSGAGYYLNESVS